MGRFHNDATDAAVVGITGLGPEERRGAAEFLSSLETYKSIVTPYETPPRA
jgi:hypothetical protein